MVRLIANCTSISDEVDEWLEKNKLCVTSYNVINALLDMRRLDSRSSQERIDAVKEKEPDEEELMFLRLHGQCRICHSLCMADTLEQRRKWLCIDRSMPDPDNPGKNKFDIQHSGIFCPEHAEEGRRICQI